MITVAIGIKVYGPDSEATFILGKCSVSLFLNDKLIASKIVGHD